MSEQLPSTIPNNFQLQEQPSGLIVAESRVNHSHTEHPRAGAPTVKTRGMGYTETTLGGHPFTIAEQLQPGIPNSSEANVINDTLQASVEQEQPNPDSPPGASSEPRPEDYVPNWTSPTLGQEQGAANTGRTSQTDQPKPEANPQREALESELARLAPVLAKRRADYARTAAGRSKSTVRFGHKKQYTFGEAREFSKKALEYEKGLYETVRNKVMGLEANLAEMSGVSPDDLEIAAEVAAAVDASRLAHEVSNQQKLAAGGYVEKMGADGKPAVDYYGLSELELVKPLGRFKEFWGRRSGAKFFSRATLEKTLAIGVPSVAVGLGASVLLAPAIAAGVIGGTAAAGVYGALRVTKTLMATRLNKHGKLTIADRERNDDQQYLDSVARQDIGYELSENIVDQDTYAELVAEDTNSNVTTNRRALGITALSLAFGTGAGEVLGHALGLEHHSANHGTKGHQGLEHHSANHGTKGHRGPKTHHSSRRVHHQSGSKSKDITLKLKDLHAAGQSDSVESEVSGYMHQHGYNDNAGNVRKVTQAVLNREHVSWAGAHDLQPGYTFHIPHNVLEEITKKK